MRPQLSSSISWKSRATYQCSVGLTRERETANCLAILFFNCISCYSLFCSHATVSFFTNQRLYSTNRFAVQFKIFIDFLKWAELYTSQYEYILYIYTFEVVKIDFSSRRVRMYCILIWSTNGKAKLFGWEVEREEMAEK